MSFPVGHSCWPWISTSTLTLPTTVTRGVFTSGAGMVAFSDCAACRRNDPGSLAALHLDPPAARAFPSTASRPPTCAALVQQRQKLLGRRRVAPFDRRQHLGHV